MNSPPDMLKSGEFRKRENWYITNPNLGASVDEEFISEQNETAERDGPAAVVNFLAKHLNVEITQGLRSDGWAGAEHWSKGLDESLLTLDDVLERCEVVTVGIDGGGADDLLGVAVIGREKLTKRWLGWAHAFISPEGLDRRKANRSVYDGFETAGDLTYVKHMPEDIAALIAVVEKVKDSGLLAQVGVDAAGLGLLIDALAEIGISEEAKNLGAVRQGFGLMDATKTIERKLIDGTFKHGGQALMAWCAGNAIVQQTPTGSRIVRDQSGLGKIDPLMALMDAAALMARNPEAGGSVYTAERGLLSFG